MDKIEVKVAGTTVSADRDVWSAFLLAASLVVDTGDMYPHLESRLGVDVLDRVKQLKIDLDDQNSSS
jgi:hypothetical protein